MKISKLLASLLVLLAVSPALFAQQDAEYTQFMFNRAAVNPAYVGTKHGLSMTVLYRHQWVGFDGAPKTVTLNGHSRLGESHHGVGGFFINDTEGPLSRSAFGINYAYILDFGKYSHLSFGVQAAGLQRRYNPDNVVTATADPAFSANNETAFLPDVGAGVFYYNRKFYAGFSATHLVEQEFNLGSGSTSEDLLRRHFWATAGYDISLGKQLVLTPALMASMTADAPTAVMANLNLMMLERFWIGSTYAHERFLGFLVGFYPTKTLRIGYSYDYALNDLNRAQNGTHEIMLSLDLGRRSTKIATEPRYF